MNIPKYTWLSRLICFGSAVGFFALGLFILQQDDLVRCVSTKLSGVLCSNYSGTRLMLWGSACMLLGGVPIGLCYLETHPTRAKICMGVGFLAMLSLAFTPLFKN